MPSGVYPRSLAYRPSAKLIRPVVGQRFGRLTIISDEIDRNNGGVYRWLVRCDCGKERWVQNYKLRTGLIISCGCWAREKIVAAGRTHGMSASPEHHAWSSMHDRCMNAASKSYRNYGGRGITVCPEWATFEQFYADMGPRPSPSHSIDRVNNDLGYSPDNCRWATKREQSNNRRGSIALEYDGLTLPISAWAERTGFTDASIRSRLSAGWTIPEALTGVRRRRRAEPKRIQRTCETCGAHFDVPPSASRRRFCGRPCFTVAQRRVLPRPPRRPVVGPISRVCVQCGRTFHVFPYRATAQLCSMACSGLFRKGLKMPPRSEAHRANLSAAKKAYYAAMRA